MNKKILKILLLSFVIVAIALFFIFDLERFATLDFIKSQQVSWQNYYAQNQWFVLAIFFLSYIIVTALSLPIAAILTLLSGALFGLTFGLIVASFASTMGATLAFLMARFLIKDYIKDNYGKHLEKINQGFEREGAFYLFALRLVPIFPFFIINVLMALTPLKTHTFYWVSQLGMFAGTAVYVYAGTQLSTIKSLSDITSAKLLIAFALLGIFPLLTKKLLTLIRTRKNATL